MVFLPIEAYERREAELTLLEKLLMAEQNRLDGAPTYPLDAVVAEPWRISMPRYLRVVLLAEARDELRQIALIHKVKVGSKCG